MNWLGCLLVAVATYYIGNFLLWSFYELFIEYPDRIKKNKENKNASSK